MKKNKMLRIASVMLVLALITTCIISGTFAKYVTSKSASDRARVAKWGVQIVATSSAFGKVYNNVSNNNTAVGATYSVNTHSVQALATNDVSSTVENETIKYEKVVAPGTKGTILTATVWGTPEVNCTVQYEATLSLKGWVVDSGDGSTEPYCPIVFKIGDTAYTFREAGHTDETVDQFAARVAAALNAIGKINDTPIVIPAGTNLVASNNYGCTVSWEWPFETGHNDTEKAANNVKDTQLGDAEAPGTIEFNIKITVAQED